MNNSGTLDTALELDVTVEYDCVDEDGIEITRITRKGSGDLVERLRKLELKHGATMWSHEREMAKECLKAADQIEVFVKDITQIQYDSLIDQINADLAAQKQEALDFQAECMRDDSKHDPNW